MPNRTPDPHESTITITFDGANHALVAFPYWNVSHEVSIGPDPAWPSPDQVNDRIADAVRLVLDHAYYAATGTRIEREAMI